MVQDEGYINNGYGEIDRDHLPQLITTSYCKVNRLAILLRFVVCIHYLYVLHSADFFVPEFAPLPY